MAAKKKRAMVEIICKGQPEAIATLLAHVPQVIARNENGSFRCNGSTVTVTHK